MARRKTEVFSMSFLDCITCAFGSVVLVYTLINAQGGLRKVSENQAQRAQVAKLEEQVLEGYQHLVPPRAHLNGGHGAAGPAKGRGTRAPAPRGREAGGAGPGGPPAPGAAAQLDDRDRRSCTRC